MRLSSDAVAALTLGPGMLYSALMQAALRMRQLARGQRLIIVLTAETEALLRQACGLADGDAVQVEHVVQWAVMNTIGRSERVRNPLLRSWIAHGHEARLLCLCFVQQRAGGGRLIVHLRLTIELACRHPPAP